jgi:hypothetical protein
MEGSTPAPLPVLIAQVVEESQLIFQAAKASVDCVAMVTENIFASGNDDGYVTSAYCPNSNID